MTKIMAKTQTKKRYRAVDNMVLGEFGAVQRGEIVDTDQVAAKVLAELHKLKQLQYVDTVQFNKDGDEGRGSWDAVAEPEPAADAFEPTAKEEAEAEDTAVAPEPAADRKKGRR